MTIGGLIVAIGLIMVAFDRRTDRVLAAGALIGGMILLTAAL